MSSPEHPLGHGRAIYFWSFIVALMLFSMGGLFSIYEGVHKLGSTEPVRYPWVAVGILTFGIVAESISLWGALREINEERGQSASPDVLPTMRAHLEPQPQVTQVYTWSPSNSAATSWSPCRRA